MVQIIDSVNIRDFLWRWWNSTISQYVSNSVQVQFLAASIWGLIEHFPSTPLIQSGFVTLRWRNRFLTFRGFDGSDEDWSLSGSRLPDTEPCSRLFVVLRFDKKYQTILLLNTIFTQNIMDLRCPVVLGKSKCFWSKPVWKRERRVWSRETAAASQFQISA